MEVYKSTQPLKDEITGKYFYPLTVASQVDMGNGTKLDKFLENELSMDLLWTNANPTSAMTPQTINLDLSKYRAVKVFYNISMYVSNTDAIFDSGEIQVGTKTRIVATHGLLSYRSITVSTNSIDFGEGRYWASYDAGSSSVSNNMCIPYKIYGVKFTPSFSGGTTNNTDLINTIYPIGSIYMSVNNVNPAILFGGTWEQIKDTFLLSAGDTYAAGATGGEAQHTLTTAELPKNIGNFVALRWASNVGESGAFSYVQRHADQGGVSGGTNWGDALYTLSGGGQAHGNMPPYLAVYMWKRTA